MIFVCLVCLWTQIELSSRSCVMSMSLRSRRWQLTTRIVRRKLRGLGFLVFLHERGVADATTLKIAVVA